MKDKETCRMGVSVLKVGKDRTRSMPGVWTVVGKTTSVSVAV